MSKGAGRDGQQHDQASFVWHGLFYTALLPRFFRAAHQDALTNHSTSRREGVGTRTWIRER